MGGKSAPVPDYASAAEKTAASANQQLTQQNWANRPTQTDAYGNTTSWQTRQAIDPGTGQPITQWAQNVKLSDQNQQAYDSQMDVQNQRSQVAQTLLPQVRDQMSKQIDFSQFTPLAQGPQGQQVQAATNPYGFGPQQQNIDTSRMATPGLQNQYNYGGLQGVQDASGSRQTAYDTLMGQASSRLDPQWQQQETALSDKLANQGITQGSASYDQAMKQFQQGKTDAYQQAMYGASQGATQQAQADNAINMGLRQQQMSEAQSQGNLYNQAAGQAFGFGGQAAQQQLAAQQAAYNQSLQGSQYGLQQQNQGFNQQMGAAQQNYNMQLGQANFQNQTRQQQIAEAQQQQNWSLNDLNALLTGQQVGSGSFQGFNQAGLGQGTDYSGAMQNTYTAQQNQANAQNAMAQSALSGAGSMAMAFSDRRVKADVRTVRRDPRGWRIVSFRYIGERGRRVGVIAQEVRRVRPDAVSAANDVLMVDYLKLYGA